MLTNWMYADCPSCDTSMDCIEDDGICDTRDGESYGATFACPRCHVSWYKTTGVRNSMERIED